jgi:PAS domain S-box-containing protein
VGEPSSMTNGGAEWSESPTLPPEVHLASIVDSSDDAIVSKDLNGIVTSWNPAAERIFGYSSAEMIGQPIRTIIPPDRQHEEDEVLKRIRSDERVDHFQTVRQRKDGSQIHISLTVSPIKGPDGVIVGASKIARDITSQRRAEEQLAAAAALKDSFLSLVSHELRTPIAIVVGNASMLLSRRSTLSEDTLEQALQDIASEGRRLQGVIENLLVITRTEASPNVAFEPVSLRPLVVEQVARQVHQKPTRRIEVVCPDDLPFVNGEPALISMVVDNLLSNADKYSPASTMIEVSLGSDGPGKVVLRVRDHGIGIEESDIAAVFTPFYRTAEAEKQAKGMGLGLSVCKRIVEAHGGTIVANTPSDGGTEFIVTFPSLASPTTDHE